MKNDLIFHQCTGHDKIEIEISSFRREIGYFRDDMKQIKRLLIVIIASVLGVNFL